MFLAMSIQSLVHRLVPTGENWSLSSLTLLPHQLSILISLNLVNSKQTGVTSCDIISTCYCTLYTIIHNRVITTIASYVVTC